MEGYPWTVLNIAPTTDERAIRKAYAALLKRNRPDEAPEVFQALVRARDMALKLAQDQGQGAAGPQAATPGPTVFEVTDLQRLFPDVAGREVPRPLSSVPEPKKPRVRTASGFQAVPRTDLNDIVTMLDALAMPGADTSLKMRWSKIFDQAELAPLELHETIMAQILCRLVADLRRHVGDLPEAGLFARQDDDLLASTTFRGYDAVLADFERRFQILNEDRVLQRYLHDHDALYLTDALSQATGRTPAFSAQLLSAQASRLNAIPLIDPDFVTAAFGDDPKILDFYQRCRLRGTYEILFSWMALLVPFVWALYYRLTGLAWLFGTLIATMTSIAVLRHFGLNTQIDDIVPAVYGAVTLACAFQSGRLRIQEFARSVVRIQAKDGSHQDHVAKAARAARPSPIASFLGVLFLGACCYIAVLYGLVLDVVPL